MLTNTAIVLIKIQQKSWKKKIQKKAGFHSESYNRRCIQTKK